MSDPLVIDVPAEIASGLSALPPTAESDVTAPLWHTATVSTLDEVELLLAQAERTGHREHELIVLGPNTFVVRWR